MHILILEDNSATLFLLKRILRISDCEISNYARAEHALSALKNITPDFALVDIQLAGHLTGLDFIKTVREAGNRMPIIALTAYALDGERQKCIDAGCNEYVAKPFNVTELTKLLKQYLVENHSTATA